MYFGGSILGCDIKRTYKITCHYLSFIQYNAESNIWNILKNFRMFVDFYLIMLYSCKHRKWE